MIANYDNVLKMRYMRELGIDNGHKAYQDFSTKLANSHAALRQSPGSCDMADALLTLAINASDAELPTLARSFSERPVGVGDECAMVAPVVTAEVVKAVPDGQPLTVAVAAASPAQAAPPAASASPAAALEAAAIALQSAAASLKAQSAPDPVKPAAAPATGEAASPVT